jgi:hypothetical protein
MRNGAYRRDVGVEPDIILLGPGDSVVPPYSTDGSPARGTSAFAGLRRLRRFVEPGVLVVGAGAMLLAGQITGGGGSPAVGLVTSPAARPSVGWRASVAPPRLLAPHAAAPGERITVLAFRNRRLCGPEELRFDGVPVVHRLAHVLGPVDPDRVEMFVTVEVPRSARPGRHEIELYGPTLGGRSGQICADLPEHQAKLATVTITVGPRGV